MGALGTDWQARCRHMTASLATWHGERQRLQHLGTSKHDSRVCLAVTCPQNQVASTSLWAGTNPLAADASSQFPAQCSDCKTFGASIGIGAALAALSLRIFTLQHVEYNYAYRHTAGWDAS